MVKKITKKLSSTQKAKILVQQILFGTTVKCNNHKVLPFFEKLFAIINGLVQADICYSDFVH